MAPAEMTVICTYTEAGLTCRPVTNTICRECACRPTEIPVSEEFSNGGWVCWLRGRLTCDVAPACPQFLPCPGVYPQGL